MSVGLLHDDSAVMLAERPRDLWKNAAEMFSVPYDQVREWQLQALSRRFDMAVGQVPMFGRLADQAGVGVIDSLADGGRLLYPSGIYKSYKASWLETGAFDKMTSWLQQLTAHDLSSVDLTDCSSLDDWFAALEQATPLRVCHSSATSGKLSFVPRGEAEWRRRATTLLYANEAAGIDEGPDVVSFAGMPIVSPFYRSGHSAFLMSLDWNIRVHGDEAQVETLYPGHLSSDLLVLAAKLRTAAGSGTLPTDVDGWDLPKSLAERWDQVRELSAQPPADRFREFVEKAHARFGGQPVFLIGVWPSLVDAAAAASACGLSGVFASDSIVHTGGGSKGRDLPTDAERQVLRWLGVPSIQDTYGMSEVMGMNVRCSDGKYHINPWTIPFVLDVGSRAPLPMSGQQSGLFGAIDLLADSYWGGFQSADVVTLTWNPTCGCGRQGPYLNADVRRLSTGTDDKVSCAATPALHDDLATLLRRLAPTGARRQG